MTPRRLTRSCWRPSRWPGSTSTGIADVLPGDHVIGGEQEIEQRPVVGVVAEAVDDHTGREWFRGGLRQHADRHFVAAGHLLRDDVLGEGEVATLPEMEHAGHQKIKMRRAWRRRAAISPRETGTTRWPSLFQSVVSGRASASTWKGTPRARRLSRNLAMSSPSTRASVSSSSRWTAGPRSTKATAFSPATTPTPIRMASKARPEWRGSAAITTRTGRSPVTARWGRRRSVEGHEPIGTVEQVRQHDQTAVSHPVGIAERELPLLAAVGTR